MRAPRVVEERQRDQQLGLAAASRPTPYGPPKRISSSTTWSLLVDLDREHAAVAPL
jgi:hypothetical protein